MDRPPPAASGRIPVALVLRQVGDLGAILRAEFSHDAANMNFDRAFLHAQLMGDDLVRRPLSQGRQDVSLTGREFARFSAVIGLACSVATIGRQQAASRHIDAACSHQAYRFDSDRHR